MPDMPAIPILHEPLSDGVVEVRDAAEWDIPEILIAHRDDPELHVRLGLRRPPSGAELGQAIDREPAERASGSHAALTIVEAGGRDCRGRIEVGPVDWADASARLQIWIAPQLRGRGFARRSLELTAAWLLETVGLSSLILEGGAGAGEALVRAATAAGFSPDGVSLVRRARDRAR
jgi:RimJ/RimL family protein N-acetyltransferase